MLQGLRGKKLVETTSKSKGDRLPGREPETKFAPIDFAQSAGAGFAPFPVVLKLHHYVLTHARLKQPPSDWHGSIATSHRAHSAVLVDSGAPLQTDFRSWQYVPSSTCNLSTYFNLFVVAGLVNR